MIQELYQKAAKFAAEKHAHQKVPGSDANYMLHLSNVVMEILVGHTNNPNFDLSIAVPMALLHDTLEDTDTEIDELVALFGKEVANGVSALTKNDNLSTKEDKMLDSLKRLQGSSKEARLVKIADRITNLQQPPQHWSKEKIEKYHNQAQIIHDMLSGENDYLDNRLKSKIVEYSQYF